MTEKDNTTPPPSESKMPQTETKPVARDALTRSGEFSERGINVVALVEPTGTVPQPGGLPAATAKPTEGTPQAAPPPSESAPPSGE